MIEQKLYQAANELPQPKITFESIEPTVKPRLPIVKRFRLAAAIAAVILLVGCAATAVTYRSYSGFSWAHVVSMFGVPVPDSLEPDFDDAQKKAEQLGITIPEAFGESPFYWFETNNISAQDNYILAWLDHDYQKYWVYYGNEQELEEQIPDGPDGTPGPKTTHHFTTERISLFFGSTEGELWRDEFGFDENGVWSPKTLMEETYRTIEYQDQTMHTGILSNTYDYHDYQFVWDEELHSYQHKLISVKPRTYYTFCIVWVDKDSGTAILLYTDTREEYADDLSTGVGEEKLIEYAKQLIDINS